MSTTKLMGWVYLAVTFALTALFTCLKLDGFITWSWWIVTAPVSVSFLFAFGACCLGLFLMKLQDDGNDW